MVAGFLVGDRGAGHDLEVGAVTTAVMPVVSSDVEMA